MKTDKIIYLQMNIVYCVNTDQSKVDFLDFKDDFIQYCVHSIHINNISNFHVGFTWQE